ncbi:MAG: phenylalanine--tRNA ligase beta subunit-related protein [Candidatus Veblenbacteria bacterium]|nr:phenylalanine--tRNA ligase beta subunit-related protein [Candidatus Veblenbacteria bacterium]
MKISYNILKTFVTPPAGNTGRSLAETLTMRTVEVESYHDQAGRLAGVVVGLVTAVRPHPNADKLRLAQVGTGKHKLEVVCGGVNLQEGMKVAFANIGTKVRWHGQGDWVTLEQVSIRGVESAGMICAAEELALMDSAAVEHGIMDLSYLTAKPGTPLAEALGLHDIILEVDNKSVTHRPDLWGHLGLARELAAIWQVPFTLPEPPTLAGGAEARLKVTIEAPEHCQRYLGVVVAGLKVAESPAWLKQQLVSLGVRSINNVVEVTN